MVPVEKLVDELRDMEIGIVANRQSIATELMLPVKMLEYIALEIPVIAPDLRGIKYYFSSEKVRYYRSEDVDSLSTAIEDLYHNPAKRVKQLQAAKAFLDKYGWEKHKFNFFNFYQS